MVPPVGLGGRGGVHHTGPLTIGVSVPTGVTATAVALMIGLAHHGTVAMSEVPRRVEDRIRIGISWKQIKLLGPQTSAERSRLTRCLPAVLVTDAEVR